MLINVFTGLLVGSSLILTASKALLCKDYFYHRIQISKIDDRSSNINSFSGYHTVWGVTPALHSPLMSVTNHQ